MTPKYVILSLDIIMVSSIDTVGNWYPVGIFSSSDLKVFNNNLLVVSQ